MCSIKQSVTGCIIAEVKCCFEHIPHKLHDPREHVRGMVPCTKVSRGPASPTCRVCSCCARSCLRAVSSPGMPYALPTTAMLWMQSSTSSLFPFFRSCAMASFANCSCSALAFSIVILNPPRVYLKTALRCAKC